MEALAHFIAQHWRIIWGIGIGVIPLISLALLGILIWLRCKGCRIPFTLSFDFGFSLIFGAALSVLTLCNLISFGSMILGYTFINVIFLFGLWWFKKILSTNP